jgi:hypothetical protein
MARPHLNFHAWFLLLICAALNAAGAPIYDTALVARVGFDTNPAGTGGTLAITLGGDDTLIYSAGINLGLGWTEAASGRRSVKVTYAGESVNFDRWSEENFTSHRLGAGGQFIAGNWKINADISSLLIAGSRDTYPSTPTSNANAISLWRERRRQWQHRAKIQARASSGSRVLRVTGTWLAYDYQTRVMVGRVAFADRADAQGGLDLGWKASDDSLWFAGLRAGHQEQAWIPLPNCAFDYSNNYQRLALGWEGRLAANTTVALAAGPDFRHYNGSVDPGSFLGGRDRTSLWFEASLTAQPDPRLTITGKASRTDWLSSTGKSAYLDTCAEAAAAWTLNPAWTARFSAKVHRCDYFPASRDDWESLLGLGLAWKVYPRTVVSADLLQHRAWNNLPGLTEREFRRVVLSLGVAVKL